MIKNFTCTFYNINDMIISDETNSFNEKYLKEKFLFNNNELKRTEFCLELASIITNNNKDCSIADIGPGRRLFTGLMCEKNYKSVTAIDFKYYEGCEIKKDNFSFLEADILNIKKKFDYTFCFEVLEHNELEKLGSLIQKIKSISNKKAIISMPYYENPLKTKGHLFTLDSSLISKYFSGADIYMLYRQPGFSYIFFVFDLTENEE